MTAYRLTARVSFPRRLLLRLFYWLHRNDDYPKYTYLMQSNPQGNKRWRKRVIRAIERSEALKALTSYDSRYLIEVKADPNPDNDYMLCVGLYPIAASAHLHDSRGPGAAGALAVYFEVYHHELTHVPPAAARQKLMELQRYPIPPRHFRVALPYYE